MPRKRNPNSKSAFILSQPASLSAQEVVDKAKAAGHKISAGYVHTTRYQAKAKGSSGPKRKPGRPKGSKNKSTPSTDGSLRQLERDLLSWVAEHGAATVQAMLHTATAKIRKLV